MHISSSHTFSTTFTMVKLTAFACIFAQAAAYSIPTIQSRGGDIVNGTDADIKDFPYQILLRYNNTFDCGGTILSKDTILTAGHCVEERQPADITILVGSSDPNGGEVHNVSKIISHPKHEVDHLDYDAAILKLTTPLTFGPTVQPIGALANSEPAEGDVATVSGYGRLYDDGPDAKTLQSVQIPIISIENCREEYGAGAITDRMICAGYPDGGKDSCSGDSGGPLVVSNTIIGIVSWGNGCAVAGQAGVYTDVANSEILGFIQSNM